MPRLADIRVYVLLAALVASVAAPPVHRARHAAEDAARQARLHAGVGHVHADHAAFSIAYTAPAEYDVVCVVCSTWTSGDLAASAVAAPPLRLAAAVGGPSAPRSDAEGSVYHIRGPPRLF